MYCLGGKAWDFHCQDSSLLAVLSRPGGICSPTTPRRLHFVHSCSTALFGFYCSWPWRNGDTAFFQDISCLTIACKKECSHASKSDCVGGMLLFLLAGQGWDIRSDEKHNATQFKHLSINSYNSSPLAITTTHVNLLQYSVIMHRSGKDPSKTFF